MNKLVALFAALQVAFAVSLVVGLVRGEGSDVLDGGHGGFFFAVMGVAFLFSVATVVAIVNLALVNLGGSSWTALGAATAAGVVALTLGAIFVGNIYRGVFESQEELLLYPLARAAGLVALLGTSITWVSSVRRESAGDHTDIARPLGS